MTIVALTGISCCSRVPVRRRELTYSTWVDLEMHSSVEPYPIRQWSRGTKSVADPLLGPRVQFARHAMTFLSFSIQK
jgi:hypothetical protein